MGKKYTVPQAVADFFQGVITEWSIYEAVRRKQLPCCRIGRRILLDEETLTAWWKEQEQRSIQQHNPGESYGKIRRIQ